MNPDMIRSFLLGCMVFNFGILLLWFLMFACQGDLVYRIHNRWFGMPRERFNEIHYLAMAVFKLTILVFNFTPWLILTLMR